MPETPQANLGPTPAQSQPASGGQAEAETTPVQTPFQNPPLYLSHAVSGMHAAGRAK